MPDVLVRDVDNRVLGKLKVRARRNGRSLQNELKQVFKTIAETEALSDERTADRIKAALRDRSFCDSAVLLRKDRRR